MTQRKILYIVGIVLFIVLLIFIVRQCTKPTQYGLALYVAKDGNDSNSGTASSPFKTIAKAASVAGSGSVVTIREGIYRETATPASSDVIFQADSGAAVLISGLNEITTPWTVHNGQIYKTTVTLSNPQSVITSNTSLLANQIFDDGAMMFLARYPNISTEADLMNISKSRHVSQMQRFDQTSLQDNSLISGLSGAKLIVYGWFWPHTRTISSQPSTNTLNYSDLGSNYRYRKYYYVCDKLVLLDSEKEWFYENNTLYFRQAGGGVPHGVEYKARNWGFDIRGKDNIKIIGLQFVGCDVAHGDTNTDGTVIDNIRARFMNHSLTYPDAFPGYGNAKEVGTKLLGRNNVVKNSEFRWSASHVVWLGQDGRAENNLFEDISYDGAWGAPLSFWGDYDNVTFTRNTIRRTGRSSIDMGFSYTAGGSHQNFNIEVSYNDCSGWGMLSIDLGAVYSWGFRNLTGSVIKYNWFHDDGVKADPTGAKLDGSQRGTYFDQASGPYTVHHNVFYNNWTGLTQDVGDIYNQMHFEHRIAGPSYYYNNTCASESHYTYTTYENSPKDVQRNNIYWKPINVNWGNGNPPDEQHSIYKGQVTSQGTAPGKSSLQNTDPKFLMQGEGGLKYRLSESSPGRGRAIAIPGITTGPDLGAYQFADNANPWIPGYVPVGITPPVPPDPTDTIPDVEPIPEIKDTTIEAVILEGYRFKNLELVYQEEDYTTVPLDDSRMKYSGTWTKFNSSAGPLTYTLTTGNYFEFSFSGSSLQWHSEKAQNHGYAGVTIDNGQEERISLYGPTTANNIQLIKTWTLSKGEHKIKVRMTGEKETAATDTNIIHGYLTIK